MTRAEITHRTALRLPLATALAASAALAAVAYGYGRSERAANDLSERVSALAVKVGRIEQRIDSLAIQLAVAQKRGQ